MAEEPSLSYYLPIDGGRIIGFIPFPRVLVLCEMKWFLVLLCNTNNLGTQIQSFEYFYFELTILFNITHSFALIQMVTSIAMYSLQFN